MDRNGSKVDDFLLLLTIIDVLAVPLVLTNVSEMVSVVNEIKRKYVLQTNPRDVRPIAIFSKFQIGPQRLSYSCQGMLQ